MVFSYSIMEDILKEKLHAFILINNPDLAVELRAAGSIIEYVADKVTGVMPRVGQMLEEEMPQYIIEELILRDLTEELRPSRFHYIRNTVEEEFPRLFELLSEAGVFTYECINLVDRCGDIFNNYNFSDQTKDNRFLRYAIIAELHGYLG